MKPTKRILGLLMAVVCAIQTFAQTMTYNHDASKCGQIQVMELGAGALTPDWYYSVMHHSYKKGAKNATSVKNTLRMATNVASLPQVEYADSIKADLESRAKIEAANIADRQIDLAWLTEGEKIQSKLWAFKSNIGSLNGRPATTRLPSGTTSPAHTTLPSRLQRMPICPTASGRSNTSQSMTS